MENETEEIFREQIPSNVFVDFWISNFPMKHQELTELLQIIPTKAENIGDERHLKNSKKTIIIVKENSWNLESNIGIQRPIQEHLKHIFNIINPKKEIIKSIVQKPTEASLQILMYMDPYWREYFEIDSDFVKDLGEMNISLSVNIYSISELLL